MDIAGRRIGAHDSCFVIAEAGVNHNGDLERAHRLIDAAAAAGADAVKFQSFRAGALVTDAADKAAYQKATTGDGGQGAMLRALELSADDHRALIAHCAERGIVFLSTPYDSDSLALLCALAVPAIKVSSTDAGNLPFLREIAGTGRPVILSTGMCDLAEAARAVDALEPARAAGRLAVLHCTSEYPAPAEEANLRAMDTLRRAFGCPVGFSDHTTGIEVSVWAALLGANLVEKHFTLDRTLAGPDHRASLEPDELADLVATIRRAEAARGDGRKRVMPSEAANRQRVRRFVVARRDLAAGQTLVTDDLAAKRCAGGLTPDWIDRLTGRKLRRPVAADAPLSLADMDWEDGL